MTTDKDITIQKAIARRTVLQAEIDRLNVFLAVYEQLAAERPDTPGTEHLAAEPPLRNSEATTSPVVERNSNGGDVIRRRGMAQNDFDEFVRQLLIERGRPAQPSDILLMAHQKGRHIGGRDEVSNLKTKLWRAKESAKLAMIPGAGYWPRDVPCPAVSYEPGKPKSREWAQ